MVSFVVVVAVVVLDIGPIVAAYETTVRRTSSADSVGEASMGSASGIDRVGAGAKEGNEADVKDE